MFKRICSLLIVAIIAVTMLAGCDLMPKSVTMDQVTFKVGYTTYKFCDSTLQEVIDGSDVTCGNSAHYEDVKPGETKNIKCTFKSNGVPHTFDMVIWNNTDHKLKGYDCVIKEITIDSDGIHAIVPVSIMGVTLNDTYASFEQYFGTCKSITENPDGNVYSWKNIPEKGGAYTITVVVSDQHNNSTPTTNRIRILISPLETE